jgi:hypothetical protein
MNLLRIESELLKAYLAFAHTNGKTVDITDRGDVSGIDMFVLKKQILQLQQHYFETAASNEISAVPPFEWHPYIHEWERLKPTHKTLVLGTFPPPSYLHQFYPLLSQKKKLKGINIDTLPPLNFFYGNRGSLWDILGITLGQDEIDDYLGNNIAISDVILGLQRKSLTNNRSSDQNLYNILPNFSLIKELIEGQNNIQNIVFTSKQWDVTNGEGRGRKKKGHVPAMMQVKCDQSAISVFLQTVHQLGYRFHFKTPYQQSIAFKPENFQTIRKNICNEFCFRMQFENGPELILNVLDSPSGNAFTPFDSIIFRKWVKMHHGAEGVKILNAYPRNTKGTEKRERKGPIEAALGHEDIAAVYLNDLYCMCLKRDFKKLEKLSLQTLE